MSQGQNWSSPLGFGIVFYIAFDVDFRSSWGRFGLRLGGHLRSFWRLGRPKLVPKPSSDRLNIEKVNFHETSTGVMFEAFPGPKMATQDGPRSTQDGSKVVLDRCFCPFEFSLRFDIVFGAVLVPIWPPEWLSGGGRELC